MGNLENGKEVHSETRTHTMDHEDALASQVDGHESDVTQYSSESLDSMQYAGGKRGDVAESENPRRRSTRSKTGGKMTS